MDWLWVVPAALVLRLVLAMLLRAQGRRWWCKCGRYQLWQGDVQSMHCSQHFADPYFLAHIEHGIVIGWAIWLLPLAELAPGWRFLLAIALEGVWELVENTQTVIDRYRRSTISLGYQGDSVGNSLGDTVGCGVGYLFTDAFGLLPSLVLFIAFELLLLVWISDNGLLNIIMLVYPLEAIKKWQMAKKPAAAAAK